LKFYAAESKNYSELSAYRFVPPTIPPCHFDVAAQSERRTGAIFS